MRSRIAIDLFAGCGGLTLGLKKAGFRVVAAIDIDPLSVETYKANHKEIEVWQKDIRTLTVSNIKRKLRLLKCDLDLLAGCPPCQGFSSVRTLNGSRKVSDPRNDLVFEFLRFVKELKPKAIMMENVPGLAIDRRMEVFCEELKYLGYVYECKVLNAAEYGVPQRRRRMILLGGLFGPISFAPPDTNRPTVRDTISSLPAAGESGDPLHDFPENHGERVMNFIKKIPENGGSRRSLGKVNQLPCHRRSNGFRDIYGRMAWDDVAPTITGGCINPSKGRFLHPEAHRAITLREAALLQSFPLDYYFSLSRGKFAAAEMIGNALPPEFIRRHSLNVYKYLTRYYKGR